MNASRMRRAWPALALVLLVAALYWPGRGGGFVFDDYPNIVDNIALHVTGWDRHAWLAAIFSSDSGLGHRPLPMATFALIGIVSIWPTMTFRISDAAACTRTDCSRTASFNWLISSSVMASLGELL